MKYSVDGWNNFCRVFELPDDFPKEYCFGGGHDVVFKMVDWFNPVEGIGQPGVSKKEWIDHFGSLDDTISKEVYIDKLYEKLKPFMLQKQYVKTGKTYIIICDFGATMTFVGGKS